VFCHPDILISQSELIEYYRNIAALSQKGLSQILSGRGLTQQEKSLAISKILNGILSQVVANEKAFSKDSTNRVLFAELGAEIQGTWVNIIGAGAAKQVEQLILEFVQQEKMAKSIEDFAGTITGKRRKQRVIRLTNDWQIIFASEPDIAIRDTQEVLQIAIEIKGSMDKAGAQTRYGEAKKSFGKALSENPRCETIYLASCFTQSVLDQIRHDGQVRKIYNLIDILQDTKKRNEFLDEIFKYLIRIRY
ncbi:MAG: XcyI family restriction endonuclease, partial [bacterium]